MALGTVNVGRHMNPADYVKANKVGVANGVASLDADGKLPDSQIPAGLSNVDNTSDVDKPVSTVQAEAIADAKAAGTDAQSNLESHIENKTNPHGVTKTQVGLGNVDNTSDANKPVSTAQATAIADAKKAGTDAQTVIDNHVADKNNPHGVTAAQAGADPVGTASSVVGSHNTNTEAHNDIRLLVTELTNRLNALADSDDTTLDQLSEIVAYIKSNKSLIDSITTDKVNVADIVNDLVTNVSNKPLSAAQGVALKALIDAMVVDSVLSDSSTNPVQNMVVKAAIDQLNAEIEGHTHDYAPMDHTHDSLVVSPENYGTVDPNTAGIEGVEGQIYLVIIE